VLSKWPYQNAANETGATLYYLWWRKLYAAIWDEFRNQNMALRTPGYGATQRLLFDFPQDTAFDVLSTTKRETPTDLIRMAYAQAVDSAYNWQQQNGQNFEWGTFKATQIRHILRLAPFSVTGLNVGGGGGIVNATKSTHGPSWRMVVMPGPNGPDAWGVYPGGQSGNPGNPFYSNMVEKWAQGQYNKLWFMKSRDDVRGTIMYQNTLNPKNAQ